mgnify:FL=1
MKLTKQQLKQIIKEELEKVLKEEHSLKVQDIKDRFKSLTPDQQNASKEKYARKLEREGMPLEAAKGLLRLLMGA